MNLAGEDLAAGSAAFCSSLPYCMSVGPTVFTVSMGTGARARIDSSKKTNCSISLDPGRRNSLGQPIPSHPSLPICRTISRVAGRCRARGQIRSESPASAARRSRRAAPGAARPARRHIRCTYFKVSREEREDPLRAAELPPVADRIYRLPSLSAARMLPRPATGSKDSSEMT